MTEPDTDPKFAVSAMVRAALIVADLERSTAFYRDLLQLSEVYFDGDLTHDAVPRLLGITSDQKVRARILKAPGPSFGMVGLFEITPPPARLQKCTQGVHLGEAVLVFYAADLDPIVKRLEAGGHPIICPPIHLQVSATIGQREMTCADPDGVLINLIESEERANQSR
jgi:catechol 2,3-dioxygenase-like lactoylglutathione lyase family enzyme